MVMVLGGSGTANGITSFSSPATFNSTLSITGALTQSSGAAFNLASGQLAFPATQNASSDANTLDDYEEGSWTPTLVASGTSPTITYSSQLGNYVKIGKQVSIQFDMRWSNISAAGSGTLWIGGLPFVPNSVYSGGILTEKSKISVPANTYSVNLETYTGGVALLYLTCHYTSGSGTTVISSTEITTGSAGYLIGSITYFV